MNSAPELVRELSPFEHQVLLLVCDGLTNAAIAKETHHTEKVIENTVSRVKHAFKFENPEDHNLRVMLALAYRTQFGDMALKKLAVDCQFAEVTADGRKMCHIHKEVVALKNDRDDPPLARQQ